MPKEIFCSGPVMTHSSCVLYTLTMSQHWSTAYLSTQATTTGSGATLPTMLALVWCSGWQTALRTERASWTRSRLRSRGTGGHGPLKVCRDTETSRPKSDTCTKIRFTFGTKRRRSTMSLCTCEHRMPLRTLSADWLWGLTQNVNVTETLCCAEDSSSSTWRHSLDVLALYKV